jgi:NAD(P)H-dependent flavin oxidoreductase YrpB (nitropropane dioxygenase family)
MSTRASFLSRLGLQLPVVQAAMAGEGSGADVAGGVSQAGGLGSIGMRAPHAFRNEIERARGFAPGHPIAAGLLLPFTRRAHVDALLAGKPDAAILTAGFAPAVVQRLRAAGIYVMHQVGSAADARKAVRDGADALIAQGVEAGGHVLGVERSDVLLPQVFEVAGDRPVLLSGGIATADDVSRALALGASAALAGSRYVLTHESTAHPAYKERILGATRTMLTQLFGVGWTLKHRVAPNAATERWCDGEGDIPGWLSTLQRRIEGAIQPFAMLRDAQAARGSVMVPLYTPASLVRGQRSEGVETTPLYAGECVARIHSLAHAYDVTRMLGGKS